MPTYEYECSKCGHRFERFQGINDQPMSVCPTCGAKPRRLISAGVGIITRDKDNSSGQNRLSRCGHDTPCCGKDSPCESPPCAH